MEWRAVAWASVCGSLALAACAQTSRVGDEQLAPAALAQGRKAIAVMRVGSASPTCVNVAALLGVREASGFRRHTPVRVANVRSLTEAPVAEVELDAGEYHVIAYACSNARGHKVLADSAGGNVFSDDYGLFRTSYASFRLEPGEVVNVGYLQIGASHVGRSAFGRPLRIDVAVTDWPLAELERFKARRPAVFAQMKTRLMKVEYGAEAATGQGDCVKLRQMLAEGKVQTLPAACAGAVAKPAGGT